MLSRLPPAILEEIPMRFPALSAFALALASIFTALATAQTTAPSSANWSYEGKTGPLVWDKLDPAYRVCSKGHEQSPINIRGARLNTALQPIEFHYIAGPVTLVNDGRTIVAHVDPVSSIVAGGVRYNLVEFSFHRPSEQAMRGKLSDMEVDLLHRSADGKLAVVAVRLTEDTGNANATLAALFADLPATAGASEKITEMVNPGCRPRLLDLHGFAHHPALHRGGELVCLRAAGEHQPRAIPRLCVPVPDEHPRLARSARAAHRGQRVNRGRLANRPPVSGSESV
jgi:carbonic anhydrase